MSYIKKPVEHWLNDIDYTFIGYIPSEYALLFINFIKEVNDGSEENESALIHLKMMDCVFNGVRRCAILVFRGAGKTTIFAEYLILFIAAFGYLPGFGKLNLAIYVSDSIENGVKNLRRNIEYRYTESEFLQKLVPNKRITYSTEGHNPVDASQYEEAVSGGRKFTDVRLEFCNNKGHRFIVKCYGAKALSLDTKLYTESGYSTIGECKVGDRIYGADGKLSTITAKSEIFNKSMYRLELEDGRFLKISEDHINSVMVNVNPNNKTKWVDKDLTTKELLEIGWEQTKPGNHNHRGTTTKSIMRVRNIEPIEYPEKELTLDPYTLGLILGDGSIKKNASGIVLTGAEDDVKFYRDKITYELGKDYHDKRNNNVVTFAIKGINQKIRDLGLAVHGNDKFIPEEYFTASIEQRTAILRGLIDTDGSIYDSGRITFVSKSAALIQGVARLVRSLGGKITHHNIQHEAERLEIWIGINPSLLPRKASKYRSGRRHWNNCRVVNIERIVDEPSQCIAIDNSTHQFIAGEYFRTHNTGVRGAKELGKRPELAILDDLVSDTDAESATVINTIENTVYKAVSKALHPTHQKIIWLGTPFNAKDPLYKAVESGAWQVAVFPICEKFPVSRKDFKGAWEDRFPYEYVEAEYKEALALGKPENFNQELMLRIMSEEDRLVLDSEIQWYHRADIIKVIGRFNIYITTDFATEEKQKSDWSFISVWAVNHLNQFYWIDGICKKQLMDKNVDDLFRLVQMYNRQGHLLGVGIEISGQQKGFVSWIQKEMIQRNVYFTLCSDKNTAEVGLRPSTSKLQRFMVVLPWFKQKKFFFPIEMKEEQPMLEMVDNLTLVSKAGFKSKHDDAADTVSQLGVIDIWLPDPTIEMHTDNSGIWSADEDEDDFDDRLGGYIV